MKTKGKISAVLSASVLVLALGACNNDKEDSPVVTPAPSVSTTTEVSPPPTFPDGTVPSTEPSSEPTAPDGVEAPKGLPEAVTGSDSPASYNLASNKKAGPYYFYAAGSQGMTTKGVYQDVQIAKPYLNTADYHSLQEIAVSASATTSGKRNIVEIGWTVDRQVNNGSDDPHLFVFHWVDGQPACYNGCGFVQYGGSTARAGMPLPVNTIKKMGIQYFNGNWWTSYDNKWVGYFPGTLWSAATPTAQTFTAGDFLQTFGEIAAGSATPCTDMGTGYQGFSSTIPAANKAKVNNVRVVNGSDAVDLYFNPPTNSTYYTIAKNGSERSYTYGGPGDGAVVGGC